MHAGPAAAKANCLPDHCRVQVCLQQAGAACNSALSWPVSSQSKTEGLQPGSRPCCRCSSQGCWPPESALSSDRLQACAFRPAEVSSVSTAWAGGGCDAERQAALEPALHIHHAWGSAPMGCLQRALVEVPPAGLVLEVSSLLCRLLFQCGA